MRHPAADLEVPAVLEVAREVGLLLPDQLSVVDGLLPVGAAHRPGPVAALDAGEPQRRRVVLGQPQAVLGRDVEHEARVLEAVRRPRRLARAPHRQVVRQPHVRVEVRAVEVVDESHGVTLGPRTPARDLRAERIEPLLPEGPEPPSQASVLGQPDRPVISGGTRPAPERHRQRVGRRVVQHHLTGARPPRRERARSGPGRRRRLVPTFAGGDVRACRGTPSSTRPAGALTAPVTQSAASGGSISQTPTTSTVPLGHPAPARSCSLQRRPRRSARTPRRARGRSGRTPTGAVVGLHRDARSHHGLEVLGHGGRTSTSFASRCRLGAEWRAEPVQRQHGGGRVPGLQQRTRSVTMSRDAATQVGRRAAHRGR